MVRALQGELLSTSIKQYKDTGPSHSSPQSLQAGMQGNRGGGGLAGQVAVY